MHRKNDIAIIITVFVFLISSLLTVQAAWKQEDIYNNWSGIGMVRG